MPLDCFVAKPPRSDDLHRPSSRSRTWAEAIQAPPSPPVIARSPRRSDPGPPLRWTASSQGLLAVTDITARHREEFPTKRSRPHHHHPSSRGVPDEAIQEPPPLDCFVAGPPRSDGHHHPSLRGVSDEAIQAPPSPPVIARSPRRSDPGPPLRWTASSQGLLAVTDTTTRHREEFPTKRSKILPPLDCFVRGKRYARPRACRRMAACRISPTVFSGVSVVKN
jgi:hypothetical protein